MEGGKEMEEGDRRRKTACTTQRLRHRRATVVVADAVRGRSRISRKSGGESTSELQGKHCSHWVQPCNVPALEEIKWKKGNIDLGEQELQGWQQLQVNTGNASRAAPLGSARAVQPAPERPSGKPSTHTGPECTERMWEEKWNSQSEAAWPTSHLCPSKTIRATPGGWRAKAARACQRVPSPETSSSWQRTIPTAPLPWCLRVQCQRHEPTHPPRQTLRRGSGGG